MTAPLNDQFLKSLFPDLDQFLITFAKRIPIHSCRPANVPYTSANDTTIHKDLINDKKNTLANKLCCVVKYHTIPVVIPPRIYVRYRI